MVIITMPSWHASYDRMGGGDTTRSPGAVMFLYKSHNVTVLVRIANDKRTIIVTVKLLVPIVPVARGK